MSTTIARRLHQQRDYAGRLRAAGDVLLDQLPHMLRRGFDAAATTPSPSPTPPPSTTWNTTASPPVRHAFQVAGAAETARWPAVPAA